MKLSIQIKIVVVYLLTKTNNPYSEEDFVTCEDDGSGTSEEEVILACGAEAAESSGNSDNM
ncbi:unnamed protein product [Arabis nemorensis]|uniref:Uncharacterized protein n=1 Tax=Arabis nemorensis TaxID=586526 RepID=A0A565CUT7_9BRAS|nr:unnamed protein product [Arabis nemorensis]